MEKQMEKFILLRKINDTRSENDYIQQLCSLYYMEVRVG